MSELNETSRAETATSHSYAEWAKGLVFGPYIEDEIIAQVRSVAEAAFNAGRHVGRLEALTHPDDA